MVFSKITNHESAVEQMTFFKYPDAITNDKYRDMIQNWTSKKRIYSLENNFVR